MKKVLLILSLCPILCLAQTNEVIKQTFDKLSKQTLQSDFTITITEKANQPTSFTGSITMCGEKFRANLMGMEVAFDGKTMYTYSEDMNELTLSNPLKEELTDINPLLFAKAIYESCQSQVREHNGSYVISLVPTTAGTGVKDFVLTINKADLLPQSAVMRQSDMTTTKIVFRNAKYTSTKTEYTISQLGAYINDLR